MDAPEWNRTYAVLSISRLYLRDRLGFSTEQVTALTDEDMQIIADLLQQNFLHSAGMNFDEEASFVTRVFLAEVKEFQHATSSVSVHENSEAGTDLNSKEQ